MNKYILYSAFSYTYTKSNGDRYNKIYGNLHIAQSTTNEWEGPYEKKGPVLTYDKVPFHNKIDVDNPELTEWGLEAPSVVVLPSGLILMKAVVFLPSNNPKMDFGKRQRNALFVARDMLSGFYPMGLYCRPPYGETGHGTLDIDGNKLKSIDQYRGGPDPTYRWHYEQTTADVHAIDYLAQQVVASYNLADWAADQETRLKVA